MGDGKGSYSVYKEINNADDIMTSKLTELIIEYKPIELEITSDVYKLADKYLKSYALPQKSYYDAMHVAITCVYNLDALISWNCKHLANMDRKNKVNGINIQYGYKPIDIFTSMEVMYYEED